MNRLQVNSSVLRSIGYDISTATLEVEFYSGSIYTYRNVPPEIHAALMSAASKGQYFDKAIRETYNCQRVL